MIAVCQDNILVYDIFKLIALFVGKLQMISGFDLPMVSEK